MRTRLKKLLAIVLAVSMSAVMLPVSAMAAGPDFYIYNGEEELPPGTTLGGRVNINWPDKWGSEYWFASEREPTEVAVAAGDSTLFAVELNDVRQEEDGRWYGIIKARPKKNAADGEWEASDAEKGARETIITISFKSGSPVSYPFSANVIKTPFAHMVQQYDKNEKELTELDGNVLDITKSPIKLVFKLIDKAHTVPDGAILTLVNNNLPEEGGEPIATIQALDLTAPDIAVKATITKPGRLQHLIRLLYEGESLGGWVMDYVVDNGFYINSDEGKILPDTQLQGRVSINWPHEEKWGSEYWFTSTKEPTDVVVKPSDKDLFAVELNDVWQEGDGRWYGVIKARPKKNAADDEWAASDADTGANIRQTDITITFKDGSQVSYPFSADIIAPPFAYMVQQYDKNGKELTEGDGDFLDITKSPIKLVFRLTDKAHKVPEGAALSWNNENLPNDGGEPIATIKALDLTGPEMALEATITKPGQLLHVMRFSYKDENLGGWVMDFTVTGAGSANSGFRINHIKDNGNMNELPIYGGGSIQHAISINRPPYWPIAYDFVSEKRPVSIASSNAENFEVALDTVVQKSSDKKYYGSFTVLTKEGGKDQDGNNNWFRPEHLGSWNKTTNLTITMSDGSTVNYTYIPQLNDTPLVDYGEATCITDPSLVVGDSYVAQSGKTYKMQFSVYDANEVLQQVGDHEMSMEINVLKGTSIMSIDKLNVADSKGPSFEMTFQGRGAVVWEAVFKLDGKEITTWTVNYVVNGPSIPVGVSSITNIVDNSAVIGNTVVVELPSENTLTPAAVEALVRTAQAKGAERVELKLTERASIAIGLSSLSDFMTTTGNFDPLITLAAPMAVAETEIDIGKGAWLDFAHNGQLPAGTIVTLEIGEGQFDEEVTELYLWLFANGKLVQEETDITYSGGRCTFTLEHCSAWALYPAGYDPNTGRWKMPDAGDSDSEDGYTEPVYPIAEKGLETLSKLKSFDATNLPPDAIATTTASGAAIHVLPVSLGSSGTLGITEMATLAKLPGTVGIQIKQSGAEIILPGNFKNITEVGRFAYPMTYSTTAENKAQLLAALKDAKSPSFTCTLGGYVKLPVTATISLKTSLKGSGEVNVYVYNPATGKPVFLCKARLLNGVASFATNQLGQYMITTGTV